MVGVVARIVVARIKAKRDAATAARLSMSYGIETTGGPDLHAAVEIDHVLVQHADAAVGGGRTDRPAHLARGPRGCDLVELKRQRRCAHRVVRRATGNELRQFGMVARDDFRRRPIGGELNLPSI